MSKNQRVILRGVRIEALAAEGNSIAHATLPTENAGATPRVLFVPYAVPGDVVDVLVTKRKKNYMEGRIERLVEPSPERVKPFCEHFGVCGGCTLQHIPYPMQLLSKRRQVEDQLVRIGHLSIPEVRPTLPSERTVLYRNKLEYSASPKRWIVSGEDPSEVTDHHALGFHIGKFFDKVLDIRECHLQCEPTNHLRLFVKNWCIEHEVTFYDVREHSGILRGMIVRTAENSQVMLILCFACDFALREALLDAISGEFPQVSSLYYLINDKLNDSIADCDCILYKGSPTISESLEDLHFTIGPKSFFQTNTLQALSLYRTVREFASLKGDELVYDLYTGTGTIAQFVSRSCRKVIGIEYVREAIEDAKSNAAANAIDNCEFFAGDMKDVLSEEFLKEHGRPDVIILDPPRAGVHPDVLKVILGAAPRRIVYVSCNPATQARDLAVLCACYKITAMQPVDMFPHTKHVENVCLLERLPNSTEDK